MISGGIKREYWVEIGQGEQNLDIFSHLNLVI